MKSVMQIGMIRLHAGSMLIVLLLRLVRGGCCTIISAVAIQAAILAQGLLDFGFRYVMYLSAFCTRKRVLSMAGKCKSVMVLTCGASEGDVGLL